MTLFEDRLRLAEEIARRLLELYGDEIRAIALEGSMARGPGAVDRRSDLDIVVVAREENKISEREIFLGDVLISMGVTSEAKLLEEAGEIRWDWAIASGGLVTIRTLHDPDGVFDRIRERHERTLGRTSETELTERARGLLVGAIEWLGKGDRCLEHGSTVTASVCLMEGLITVAFSVGLFTRTRWTGSHFAVAEAANAARSIAGFPEAYTEAINVDLDVRTRFAAAHRACAALRRHFDALGARSEVGSVEALLQ